MNGSRYQDEQPSSVANSTQTWVEALRIYRNYIRTHQGLDGKTPAEASGIRIEGENKWITLIQNARRVNDEGTQ